MIERIIKWGETLLQSDPTARAWLLSYVVVPGALIGYLTSGLSSVSPFAVFEDGISIATLHSASDASGASGKSEGTVLLLDPVDLDISLQWSTPGAQSPNILTSIGANDLQQNLDRIQVDRNGVRLRLPLRGISAPAVVIADQPPGDEVLLPGKKVATKSFALVPGHSIGLALWTLIGCMFGIGLAIGATGLPASAERPK